MFHVERSPATDWGGSWRLQPGSTGHALDRSDAPRMAARRDRFSIGLDSLLERRVRVDRHRVSESDTESESAPKADCAPDAESAPAPESPAYEARGRCPESESSRPRALSRAPGEHRHPVPDTTRRRAALASHRATAGADSGPEPPGEHPHAVPDTTRRRAALASHRATAGADSGPDTTRRLAAVAGHRATVGAGPGPEPPVEHPPRGA